MAVFCFLRTIKGIFWLKNYFLRFYQTNSIHYFNKYLIDKTKIYLNMQIIPFKSFFLRQRLGTAKKSYLWKYLILFV